MKRVGIRTVWSVGEVTAALARRLQDIPAIWLEAEVHSIRPRGAHVYFTLVDGHQLSASMNAIVFGRLAVPPRDGDRVLAYGRVEFWAERTQLTMRVERLEPTGEGALLAQIEALKARLGAEGLLADARKRPLPLLPRRIGLITSGRGAARDDFCNNLWARFPADVLLVDVPVQGDAAPDAIAEALRRLDAAPEVDVIVITRGGGPLEDLMAFNSEVVCRAVAGCGTPVVSAVGHEKDVTVCDLVADRRVSTPTAAAEAVVPAIAALTERLDAREHGLLRGLARTRTVAEERCARRAAALVAALRAAGGRAEARVAASDGRLRPALRRVPARCEDRVREAPGRLRRAVDAHLRRDGAAVDRAAAVLDVLSPRRTIARGYAIVRDGATGAPLVRGRDARIGADISVELADATLVAHVTEVR